LIYGILKVCLESLKLNSISRVKSIFFYLESFRGYWFKFQIKFKSWKIIKNKSEGLHLICYINSNSKIPPFFDHINPSLYGSFTDSLRCRMRIIYFSLYFSSFSNQQVKKKPPYCSLQFDMKSHKGHYWDKQFGLMKELEIERELMEAAGILLS